MYLQLTLSVFPQLADERRNYAKKKEELVFTQHKLDTLQREQNMLLNNLDAERKQREQLKVSKDVVSNKAAHIYT